MTLAQVQAAVALITFLIATWAGLIIAVALLLPKQTSMAERELSVSPLRSFFVGLAMLIPTIVGSVMLRSPSGGVKLLGFAALVCIGAALAVGASGVALLMGRRLGEMTDMRTEFGGLVRVAMTEFGRTAYENTSLGTDHGRASCMFVLGGGVNGGKVYADWLGLSEDKLEDGGDLRVTTDYRDLLSEVLANRLKNHRLGEVFPDYTPKFHGVLNVA